VTAFSAPTGLTHEHEPAARIRRSGASVLEPDTRNAYHTDQSVTVIRTESMAGVSFALVIIGVRCEPSPAQEVHCSSPVSPMPGTSMATVSGSASPLLSWVARKNSGALLESGAFSVDDRMRQAVWKWPRCRPSPLRNELSR